MAEVCRQLRLRHYGLYTLACNARVAQGPTSYRQEATIKCTRSTYGERVHGDSLGDMSESVSADERHPRNSRSRSAGTSIRSEPLWLAYKSPPRIAERPSSLHVSDELVVSLPENPHRLPVATGFSGQLFAVRKRRLRVAAARRDRRRRHAPPHPSGHRRGRASLHLALRRDGRMTASDSGLLSVVDIQSR